MKAKKEIILIGGGGHCKNVIDVIEQEDEFKIVGIVDRTERLGEKVLGYKIFATDKDINELSKEFLYALITIGQIGTGDKREVLFKKYKSVGFQFPVIISPHAYVSKHAKIGEGTIIMHGAVICASSKIGKNCIINTKSIVEHDAVVEDNCHVSTGAIINGGVIVGRNSFIGSNSTTRHSIFIPEGSFIKAGSVVK